MTSERSPMKTKPAVARVRAVNAAFESMHREIKRFRATCVQQGYPIRVVTYRVLDNNEARCRVTYKAIGTEKLNGL